MNRQQPKCISNQIEREMLRKKSIYIMFQRFIMPFLVVLSRTSNLYSPLKILPLNSKQKDKSSQFKKSCYNQEHVTEKVVENI